MTETREMTDLLLKLQQTESNLQLLQKALKELVKNGGVPSELSNLINKRQEEMKQLGILDEAIEVELVKQDPQGRKAAESVINQVGARLQALSAGEQELLKSLENSVKGETKLHNQKQSASPLGDKLDVSQ